MVATTYFLQQLHALEYQIRDVLQVLHRDTEGSELSHKLPRKLKELHDVRVRLGTVDESGKHRKHRLGSKPESGVR